MQHALYFDNSFGVRETEESWKSEQAWRQDSVAGGAEINFGEAREVYFCEFDGETGAREVKEKGLRLKISANFGSRLEILAIFHNFRSEDPKKKRLHLKISTNSGCRLKILANLGVLGLDSHPSSPKLVYFFGAQSSLGGGGHKQSFGGARPRDAPPCRRA